MTSVQTWLGALQAATVEAENAEGAFRRDFARRVAALAAERAVAFRRLNLVRALSEAVAEAEDAEMAVAHGLALLRHRLDWHEDSEARSLVLDRFASVCGALFTAQDAENEADPASDLAAFERWFEADRGSSFWTLFEVHIPETPRVDF